MTNIIQPIGAAKAPSKTPKGLKPLDRNKQISVLGEMIPIYWFEESPTINDILNLKSADVRAVVIRDLYDGGTIKFYADLIKSGKGEVVLMPVNKKDYKYGRLLQIEYNGALNKYLELINQTPEPWALNMSVKERLANGLTEDGKKTVLLGVDPTIEYKTIWQAWFWTFGITAEWPEDIGYNSNGIIES